MQYCKPESRVSYLYLLKSSIVIALHIGLVKFSAGMRDKKRNLRIDDHDIFVGYIKKLGIEHQD